MLTDKNIQERISDILKPLFDERDNLKRSLEIMVYVLKEQEEIADKLYNEHKGVESVAPVIHKLVEKTKFLRKYAEHLSNHTADLEKL